MRRTLRHLESLGRSVKRFLQQPLVERPNFHQVNLLRRLVASPTPGSKGDGTSEDLAVAFFSKAAAEAAFLSVEEVAVVVADYTEHEPAWRDALLQEARRICRAGLPVYSTVTGPLMGGLDWSALPKEAHNDRLYRLRPHRFGFLPRLAIAASLGADTLPAVLATLERWMAQVDKGGGAADAYFSNLVIIYRLLAISWAAPFIAFRANRGDRIAAAICLQLFQILAADLQHLLPQFGQSASNNHLLADRFAAWFVTTCYPGLCPRPDRRELEQAWIEELGRQFQTDGTNFEQSLHYHELGCEMALAYLVISLRMGASVPAHGLKHIAQMLRFQAALTDGQGNGFALGDATDDPLLPLDETAGSACGAWRILYRHLFDVCFPLTDDTARGAERAFWLLAALRDVACPFNLTEGPAPLGALAAFPDNGYVVFRDDAGRQYLLFRTGPRPGAVTSPGHAMSDLLTVYWNAAGRPLLEPAGTYSYATGSTGARAGPVPARNYFRGPAAHNGVVLRGHDPLGEATTRFRESDNGARVATCWRGLDGVLGWAEGELREPGPLNAFRRGVLYVPGHYALVYDRLPDLPAGADVACHWQLAPEAQVSLAGGREAAITLDGLMAHICASSGLAGLDCVRGCGDPPAGWVSRRYGEATPAPQLICRIESGIRRVVFTLGLADKGEGPPQLEILDAPAGSLAIEVRQGRSRDIAVIGDFAGSLADHACDIEVQGQVLWLRFENDCCLELRALGLERLSSTTLGLELAPGRSSAVGSQWRIVAGEEGNNGFDGKWIRTTAG
jgi:hypothetical protein